MGGRIVDGLCFGDIIVVDTTGGFRRATATAATLGFGPLVLGSHDGKRKGLL